MFFVFFGGGGELEGERGLRRAVKECFFWVGGAGEGGAKRQGGRG